MFCLEIFPHFTLTGKLVVLCWEAWMLTVAKGPAFLAEIFRDIPQPVLANAETAHKSFFPDNSEVITCERTWSFKFFMFK
jgi:hypothetical protein